MAEDLLRVVLAGEPPSHSAYLREDGAVVVEWYDLAADRPYESANMLIFDETAQRALAGQLDLPDASGPDALVRAIGARFKSYWEVRKFADDHGLAYQHEVDFMP